MDCPSGDLEQWQLQGSAAELFERHLVPAVTLPWALDLVARAEVQLGDRVLDVACGTGAVARVAAERVGVGGRVAGLDMNRAMLAVARSLPDLAGVPIEWHEGSALSLPFGEAEFGVVLCQLGLQFFPDPVAALREVRRVLVPEGRVGLSVFAAIEASPAAHALADALDRHVGKGASLVKRNEHALADVEELRTVVRAAEFSGVRIETVVKTIRFGSVEDYVRIQLEATPLAGAVAAYDPEDRDRVVALLIEDVSVRLEPFSGELGLAFPQPAHVALATA